jgi:hypothetical protein
MFPQKNMKERWGNPCNFEEIRRASSLKHTNLAQTKE